jgi:hypothetical protein
VSINEQSPRKTGAPLNITNTKADIAQPRQWRQLHATQLFQLTEWVYQNIISAETDPTAACAQIGDWYMRCLNWYTELCTDLAHDDGRTPFVLFTQ